MHLVRSPVCQALEAHSAVKTAAALDFGAVKCSFTLWGVSPAKVAGIAGFCRFPSIVFGVSANATRKMFLALFNDHDYCVEGKMVNKKMFMGIELYRFVAL